MSKKPGIYNRHTEPIQFVIQGMRPNALHSYYDGVLAEVNAQPGARTVTGIREGWFDVLADEIAEVPMFQKFIADRRRSNVGTEGFGPALTLLSLTRYLKTPHPVAETGADATAKAWEALKDCNTSMSPQWNTAHIQAEQNKTSHRIKTLGTKLIGGTDRTVARYEAELKQVSVFDGLYKHIKTEKTPTIAEVAPGMIEDAAFTLVAVKFALAMGQLPVEQGPISTIMNKFFDSLPQVEKT